MKLINTALLILGLALASLPTLYAKGVRSDQESDSAAVVDAEKEDDFENDDEDSFKRLLSSKTMQRCPFPGELKRGYNLGDACKEGEPLFKQWKWCKKYCYMCPCWDKKSYFDFNGDLIEDACTPEFCSIKDHQSPCKCNRCKQIEILPADHFLCTPICEDVKPRFDSSIQDYVCDADCPKCPGGTSCVSDKEGKMCSCCNNKDFLGMNDKDLFEYAQLLHARGGNFCSIAGPAGSPAACKYYANQAPGVGLPDSTGCIVNDGSVYCYYMDTNAHPNLTPWERASMCTKNFIANGAAQIRYGIMHGLCDMCHATPIKNP